MMSVQAGIWNFDGKPVDPKLLARFSEALKPQGPDGEGSFIDGNIAMAYWPFHTTAESRREKQPYFMGKDVILTWDGRLDNREELIPFCRVDEVATDVEIAAAAFNRWETGCFHRLVGDWAVSIWRPASRELFLAVDYMAIRHIFYCLKQHQIWWSTDLAPLVLLSADKLHLDDDYIAGYFAHEPKAHVTPYREIREVPPGHHVRIRSERATVNPYWSFNPKSRIRYRTDPEYEEHFRYLFRQSIRRRLRSDSPVLAELSGGLDSSSVVCMADNILVNEGAETPRLDTLSYYDNMEPSGDDWRYFPKIEAWRGRPGAHIDASKLGTACGSFKYPEFDPMPGYIGSGREIEFERAHIVRNGGYRAVLSGIGGDEFMGGIPNPRAQLADLLIQFKLHTLIRQLAAWSLVKRKPWLHLLWESTTELIPVWIAQYFMKQARIEPWIQRRFAKATKLSRRLLDVDEHFGLSLPTRRSYVGGLLLMASKLAKWRPKVLAPEEARYPYLDQDLLEFMLSIPAAQLLRPGERRSLMRRSLVGIVPSEILSRRTKQFWARTPVIALNNSFEELKMAFALPLSSSFGYIDSARFLENLTAARNGNETHIVRMLRTISLEFWLRDLISRGLIAAPSASLSQDEAVSLTGDHMNSFSSLPLAKWCESILKKGGQRQ